MGYFTILFRTPLSRGQVQRSVKSMKPTLPMLTTFVGKNEVGFYDSTLVKGYSWQEMLRLKAHGDETLYTQVVVKC